MKRLPLFLAVLAVGNPISAQTVVRIVAEPARVEVTAGESAPLVVRAYGANGEQVQAALRVGAPRSALRIENGRVTGVIAGEYEIFVSNVPEPGSDAVA